MTYKEFIELNRNRDQGQYTQNHHIIPVSFGGSNEPENLITLSWLNHYYAHKLLAEEHPDDIRYKKAWRLTNIDDWLKRCYKLYQGQAKSEETKKKISESQKASMTEERKRKISESKKGTVPWNKGKKLGPLSEEHKMKISKTKKG